MATGRGSQINMIRPSSTAVGIDLSLPIGDRAQRPSPRRPALHRRRVGFQGIQTPIGTSAAEAREVVGAWQEILDIDLDTVRVQAHLRALRTWQVENQNRH